jgi:hypothetical protein
MPYPPSPSLSVVSGSRKWKREVGYWAQKNKNKNPKKTNKKKQKEEKNSLWLLFIYTRKLIEKNIYKVDLLVIISSLNHNDHHIKFFICIFFCSQIILIHPRLFFFSVLAQPLHSLAWIVFSFIQQEKKN